jgi:hypothetical protein
MSKVTEISNYRPVSLLMWVLKTMKIVMSRRLKQHLGICNVLTSEQYGFWDGISTNNDNHKLINSVYEAWNNKHLTVCIFCATTKAFDWWVMRFYCLSWNITGWWKNLKLVWVLSQSKKTESKPRIHSNPLFWVRLGVNELWSSSRFQPGPHAV